MIKNKNALLVFVFFSLLGGRFVNSYSLSKLDKDIMIEKHGMYNFDDDCIQSLERDMEKEPGCNDHLSESDALQDFSPPQKLPSKHVLNDESYGTNGDIEAESEAEDYPHVDHSLNLKNNQANMKNFVKILDQQLKIKESKQRQQNHINNKQNNQDLKMKVLGGCDEQSQ